MSIDTGCGIIVGLPYKNAIEEFGDIIDDLIHDGELDIGSIYYDSDRDGNIVGKFVFQCDHHRELNLDELKIKVIDANTDLQDLLELDSRHIFKTYMTVVIT